MTNLPQNGWSPERRARHAEAIRSWQPWLRSTGPRSQVGKARSARNAYKHGKRSAETLLLRALLANQRRLHHANATNELLKAGQHRFLDSAAKAGAWLIYAFLRPTIMQKPCILEPPEGKS